MQTGLLAPKDRSFDFYTVLHVVFLSCYISNYFISLYDAMTERSRHIPPRPYHATSSQVSASCPLLSDHCLAAPDPPDPKQGPSQATESEEKEGRAKVSVPPHRRQAGQAGQVIRPPRTFQKTQVHTIVSISSMNAAISTNEDAISCKVCGPRDNLVFLPNQRTIANQHRSCRLTLPPVAVADVGLDVQDLESFVSKHPSPSSAPRLPRTTAAFHPLQTPFATLEPAAVTPQSFPQFLPSK